MEKKTIDSDKYVVDLFENNTLRVSIFKNSHYQDEISFDLDEVFMKKWAEEDVDMVNQPPHYCRESAIECIDEMILLFGVEAVKHFCLCNAWKYRYRAADKNGEEDLNKSDWYIKKYKELSTDDEII